jgi:Rod binding domain-containing protein
MQDIGYTTETIAALGRDGAAQKLTLKLQGKQRSARDLQEAARQFESILLVRLFEEMKRTIPEGGLLNDPTCKQMNDLFWYYLAQDLLHTPQ